MFIRVNRDELGNCGMNSSKNERRTTNGFFPTPVWQTNGDWDSELPGFMSVVKRLQRDDPEETVKSNEGGWHSRGNAALSVPEFEALSQWILAEARRINPEFFFSGMWVNVNPHGSWNARHCHPRSTIAGVFYFQVPEDSGNLVLYDPRDVAVMMGGLPKLVHKHVTLVPRAGLLVMFPAWLYHSVTRNKSHAERVSLAFNCHF